MPRIMRRATAKLFPHKSPANAGGHHGTRRNHEGARALLSSYRGTTSAGPITTGDGDAPASPSLSNPAAGRRGCLSRFMRSFRPCREASAVREVRASAQLQREQDSDLRDSTLNLGRLAALRALDGTATIPLSPSQTQVSPATSRGPLRNNEPGAHAAPAAVTQARAAPVATETRTLGDGCAGSSESASQTDRQSSQVNDRLSNAPPYVGLSQDPSMAPAFSTALDTSIIRDDDTHVLYSTEHISDEAFPGTRLRIRVSSGRALGNRSQPLDHAIRMLCVILRGQQHHLTQLHLTIKHSRVVGGQCDGIDTVVALLSGVKNHLHCFLSAHVKYVCEQDEQPGQRVARDISNAFCKLLRLKIEGSTTSSRLAVFPLRHLQHLEILMKISETDVGILLRVCRSLDVLVIRSAASTHNRLESVTRHHGHVTLPVFAPVFRHPYLPYGDFSLSTSYHDDDELATLDLLRYQSTPSSRSPRPKPTTSVRDGYVAFQRARWVHSVGRPLSTQLLCTWKATISVQISYGMSLFRLTSA